MPTLIAVHNLVKRFGDVAAVDGVSFEVKAGETFGVVGPGGAGKTTLFRMLATLLPPTSGSAAINGLDVVGRSHDVRRAIGVVEHVATRDVELTVEESLRMFATLHGVPRAHVATRMDGVLEAGELTRLAKVPLGRLQDDERRRVELARSLVHEPGVLLLDELTAGLEPAARTRVWTMLRKVTSARTLAVLLTTQDADEARALCDRIVAIDRGTLQGRA